MRVQSTEQPMKSKAPRAPVSTLLRAGPAGREFRWRLSAALGAMALVSACSTSAAEESAVASVPIAPPVPAAARTESIPSIDAELAKTVGTSEPGCVIGAEMGGEPKYVASFGAASLDYPIANNPKTVFQTGSIAKSVTA